MLLVMPLMLNADVAPASSASSAGIVDFTFTTPQSSGNVPKVYIDVAKITLEIQPLMAYMPRARATYDCIGDNGDLCSKDAVQCNAVYENPTCPSGGTLNITRDMCQVAPSNFCGLGYTYDPSIDLCVEDVICPDGGVFNAITDRCEKLMTPTCPTGYAVDTVKNICWMAVDCGANAVFNAVKDRCEKPSNVGCTDPAYIFNTTTSRCEMPPVCTVGTYSATYNTCVENYNPSCDTANGYTYNSTSGHCEKTPVVCPANSNYNATTNRCEGTSACVSPAVWDSATQKCKSGGTSTYVATGTTACPSGFTYIGYIGDMSNTIGWLWNTSSSGCPYNRYLPGCNFSGPIPTTLKNGMNYGQDRFVANWCFAHSTYPNIVAAAPITVYSCPSGGTLSGTTCTVNTSTYATGTCVAGLTPDTTTGVCIANPTCPITTGFGASTFDGTKDLCWAAVVPDCSALVGTTYDSASGKCIKGPSCNSGVLDTAADVCYATACSAGYTFNATTKACEIAPTCSVGTYNTTYNKCLLAFTPGCDSAHSYAYDSTRAQCEAAPTCQDGSTYNATTNRCENQSLVLNNLNFSVEGPIGTGVSNGWAVRSYSFAHADSSGGTPSIINFGATNQLIYSKVEAAEFDAETANYAEIIVGDQKFSFRAAYNPGLIGGAFSFANMNGSVYGLVDNSTQTYTYGGIIITVVLRAVFFPGYQCDIYIKGSATVNGNNVSSYGYISSNRNQSAKGYMPSYTTSYATPSSCPNGATPDMTTFVCAANPTCPVSSGWSSSFDGTIDKCKTTYSKTCPTAGTIYDPASGMCVSSATCDSKATLNTTIDKCTYSLGDCGSWALDSLNNVCFSNPTCLDGAYNTTANQCQAAITPDCNTYTWSVTDTKCILSIICPQDTSFSLNSTIGYSASLDKCVSQTQHNCLAGYIYNGLPILQCEAVPVCLGGVYNPVNDRCFDGNSCPIGSYDCVSVKGGAESWCSPYACSGMKCGTASCPSGSSATMGGTDPSKCSSLVCDASQPYNEYCGSNTCVSGFGVYALNGKCYQDVCPSGANQQPNGSCQQLQCPSGSTEVNGLCILN